MPTPNIATLNITENLIDTRGQVPFGIFPGTLTRINGRDADYRTAMGKPASRLARHFHYKQFQYFGVISDQLLAGCALADTGWLGLAFFYTFEPATGRLQEYTWRSPLSRHMSLSDSPIAGTSRFRNGDVNIEMGYQRHADGLRKTLSLETRDLALSAHMDEAADYETMSLCTRTGINGWVYANKVAGVAIEGTLQRKEGNLSLADLDANGHHDFSAGYMRRQTFWNWACFSGLAQGHRVGLNLSCGVNETSFTENCLWVDGKIHKIQTTRFDYDRDNLLAPWQVHCPNDDLQLTFTPEGRHREYLDLKLFASNFNQLFGRYDGHVTLTDGRRLQIENLYGFVEEQYAKW